MLDEDSGIIEILGFQDSKIIPGLQNNWIPGFSDSGIPGSRDLGIQGF